MKNQSSPNTAKTYKIQFTNLIICLAIAVLLFCAAGIVFSIYRIATLGITNMNDVLKYPFLILVSLFCIALVIGILVKSQYIIDETYLISQFGFIKSKFEIKKITSMLLNMDTKKLTVYYGEEFFVLSLQKDWTEVFARDLLDVNPAIEYSFHYPSEDKK